MYRLLFLVLLITLAAPATRAQHAGDMAGMAGMAMPKATSSAPGAAVKRLTLQGGWVAATPPGVSESAAYLTLQNPGPSAAVLVGASTPVAAHTMLMTSHTDAQKRVSMQPLNRLSIPAGGRGTFAPGQAHIMLSGLRRPLSPGTKVQLTLRFSDGSARTVSLLVRRAAP
ncbi:copper chaperone PCu(A)C [Deinococcus sonorensis]|uniref:Copper chaperone PCu(A)C n=2 Tax=Deinococcus sonorensis TaxID=309891 RepID=A0AAU7U8B9_9DEIO